VGQELLTCTNCFIIVINKDDEAGQKEREAEKAKAKKPKGAEAPERERAIAMAFYHNGGNV